MIEATFKWLLEEQLKLRREAQRRMDAQRAQLNGIQSAGNILCPVIKSAIALTKGQDKAILKLEKLLPRLNFFLKPLSRSARQ